MLKIETKTKSTKTGNVTDSTSTTDLTGNGKVFKSLTENLTKVQRASDDFVKIFGEAVARKIWLGFVHPVSGEICSFIHRDNEGNIDDALSFKMWLASGKSKGGLELDNLALIENLLKGSPIYSQVMPLLLDTASIRQANEIRQSQGQPPLVSLSKEKEFYLKRITSAPNPCFSKWYQQGLPFKLIGQCSNLYLKSNNKERLELDLHLGQIEQEKIDTTITAKLAELFEIPLSKNVSINLQDPYISAKKLVENLTREGCDKEYLLNLSKHLIAMAENS